MKYFDTIAAYAMWIWIVSMFLGIGFMAVVAVLAMFGVMV